MSRHMPHGSAVMLLPNDSPLPRYLAPRCKEVRIVNGGCAPVRPSVCDLLRATELPLAELEPTPRRTHH